jgi:hypothetical protein
VQRFRPLRLHSAQVGAGHPAADAFEVCGDGVGDGAVVEGISSALSYRPVGACQIGIPEHLSLIRRAASGRVGVERVRGLFHTGARPDERSHVALDVSPDDLGYGYAGFRQMNRGFEQRGPGQFAVTLMHRPPACQRARH